MKAGVSIFRDRNGVAHIQAESVADLFWGQGFAHGTDRLMQMCLMRVLGQGRLCELLHDDDDSLSIDRFFRRMNWSKNVGKELEKLNVEDHAGLESYCLGVNAALAKSYPWEFKVLGFHPETWKPTDCILMSRMLGYLTLAQSQAEIERLFVEMVQAGISKDKLDELFPDILEGFDRELIKKITLGERIVEPSSLWNQAMPRMMASNNWVVHGKKTKSGKPLLANDPHLEANRLPNVWYESVLIVGDRYMMGASLPGIPGILSGRNNDVSWGVTYAFLDSLDSWVEQCQDGRYFREDGNGSAGEGAREVAGKDAGEGEDLEEGQDTKEGEEVEKGQDVEEGEEAGAVEDAGETEGAGSWHDFGLRKEVIRRKHNPNCLMVYFENEHGLLDGDPNVPGFYLATRWAANESGVASVVAAMNLWHVDTVASAKKCISKIETGWSFVLADSHGDIAFQMTGLVPIRDKGISGFVPLAGWESKNNWQGFYPPHLLPNCTNPDSGFLVTANNDLNKYGVISPINACMGSYRAERIADLLREAKSLTFEDMRKIQFDVYSIQAEAFMNIIKPLLPDTKQGDILRDWDLKYDIHSKGAYLFERALKCIYHDVFAVNGLGSGVFKFLSQESGVFIDFYGNFDAVLLRQESLWFDNAKRDDIYKVAVERALQAAPRTWGETQRFMLKNIFFDGKVPSIFGFDKGPITAMGGRATVHQGQIYRRDGRETTFMPSIRMVTDMARHELHSCLLGGPSDRRFSKWYDSEIGHWQKGVYKLLSPMPKKKYRFK
jgi:penicillin amidase